MWGLPREKNGIYGRRSNASTSDHKVVVVTHAPYGLDNFALIVGNDFHSFQLDPKREAVLGKESGVGVDCLYLQTKLRYSSGPIAVRGRKRLR
jgi:hypothetical protein